MTESENEQRLRTVYDAMARGDGRALAQAIDPDAVWHIPGTSQLAGTYRGTDEIFAFWRKVAELSGGGMRLEVIDVLANDDRGVVFVHGSASRGGQSLDENGVHVFRLRAGRVVEGWFFYENQQEYDAFWA